MSGNNQFYSQTVSTSEEITSAPVSSPHSSLEPSPEIPELPPAPPAEDVPIPSLEDSSLDSLQFPDIVTLSLHNSSNTGDDPVTVNLDLSVPSSRTSLFHFGRGNASSDFTYRALYNTSPTPEPRTRAGELPRGHVSNRSRSSSSNLNSVASLSPTQPSTSRTPGNVVRPPVTVLSSGPTDLHQPSKLGKYNPKDEIPPDQPYFDVEFQKALRSGKSVAQKIADTLSTCDLARDPDSQVFSMIQTANELRQFDAPSVCTIGIVGDSGVGKSSLINSLLDETNLALTGGLGTACTNVVTEYRLRQPGHTARYTIEIDRMRDEEIVEQLRELLRSYRSFHISNPEYQSMTGIEQEQLEKQSNLAWETLKAAFGSKTELTESYLQDTSVGAEERIKQQLTRWTTELKWPSGSDDGGWLGSASTVQDFKTKTKKFVNGNLWPFIKVIRIFLSSQVLKSGAVLADLPGFHDSNAARVKVAEEYMYGCDEIFVVADIGRVGTNKNVEKIFELSLGRNLKNGRPSQGIALVCTKSEDLDTDEIRERLFSSGEGETATKISQLEATILETELDDGRAFALRDRDIAQDELDCLYMAIRNDHVKNLVQSTHAKLFNNRPLSVFCVSNKSYKAACKRVRVHETVIKGSGVPSLRLHCHKIPARAQFRIAHHFLNVSLKGLVQKVQLWLAGGSQQVMPNDATIQKLLKALEIDLAKKASDYISVAREAQKATSEDIIIQPMTLNLNDWTEEALKYLERGQGMKQVAAFCRGCGSWGNSKVEYTEWNLELIQAMVHTMTLWWNNHAIRSTTTLHELQKTILKSLNDLLSEVQDFQGSPLFAEALSTKMDSVKYQFADAERCAIRKLELVQRNATQNHKSAYIYEEMYPAYYACQEDSYKVKGVTLRRLQRLRNVIGSAGNPILFTAIRDRLQNELDELTLELMNTLGAAIGSIVKQIGNDIEMLRGSEAKILAKNGNFLTELSLLMVVVSSEMEVIGDIVTLAKTNAERASISNWI